MSIKCDLCNCRVSTEKDLKHHMDAHKMYGDLLPSMKNNKENILKKIVSLYAVYLNNSGPIIRKKNMTKIRNHKSVSGVDYENGAWISIRERTINYNSSKCRCCGRVQRNPIVHHVIPAMDNPSLFLVETNLIVVCEWCHKKIHKEYKNIYRSKLRTHYGL